jgi:hypothetical protein
MLKGGKSYLQLKSYSQVRPGSNLSLHTPSEPHLILASNCQHGPYFLAYM